LLGIEDAEEAAMRKLVVSEFVSVDGVMEDPGGAEGTVGGPWARGLTKEGSQFKFEEVMAADALLLGRVTYEGFAAAWPSMKDEGGFADKMNGMPKYVVSKTLDKADWNNSTILRGDVFQEIAKLKQKDGGDILVNGSAQLVAALMEHNLVDEFRLMVFPVVLGKGKRMFSEGLDRTALKLAEVKPMGAVVTLILHPAKS
jgi:dihydrofolate reductase